MDFEEQLEKAEKLTSPSLVGSSMRSADDSAHQNYIHPEKYTGKKSKPGKLSILNSSIGASLDDLISEGALLGSEEDFERFLDDKGNVKSNAKYLAKDSDSDKAAAAERLTSPLRAEVSTESDFEATSLVSPVNSSVSTNAPASSETATAEGTSLYAADNYSAPNLSEYQLDHQIADHSQLLDLVKSYDLKKLPSSQDRERSKTNELYAASERVPKGAKSTPARVNPIFAATKADDPRVVETDSLHTPYFPRDDRSPSRSRAAQLNVTDERSRSTSRSRTVNKPHLARGDSYKSTHEDAPAKYELPAELAVEEEEEGNDRRSRQSRPTMGDSIAAAEAKERAEFHTENITRDPSLVTTGDYTNFNCDAPGKRFEDLNLYSVRSQSSTNYLRSISRSRSRQPTASSRREHSLLNEKNDANPEELAKEGALVSDDPYDQLTGLDAMVDKVLKTPHTDTEKSKNLVNDVSAEKKVTETKEQLIAEDAPTVSAEDIHVDPKEAEKASKSNEFIKEEEDDEDGAKEAENVDKEDEKSEETLASEEVDVPAEVKEQEAKEQLVDEQAPLLTAKDIKLDEVRKSEAGEVEADEVKVEATEEKQEVLPESTPKAKTESTKIDEVETLDTEPAKSATEEDVEEPSVATEADLEQKEGKEESAVDEVESKEPAVEEVEKQESATEEVKKGEGAEADADSETGKETSELPTLVSSGAESVTVDKEISGATESDVKTLEPVEESTVVPQEPATDLPTLVSTGTGSVTADKEISAESSKLETPTESTKAEEEEAKEEEAKEEAKEVKTATTEAAPEPVEDEDFDVSPEELRKHLESLPVYLFTSLAGGMKIIQRTNRLATILQGNGVKFEYRDLGTDEEAKKLWRRYAQGKLLPGVVRGDDFIGNLEYIEEVNEDYRLQEVLFETL